MTLLLNAVDSQSFQLASSTITMARQIETILKINENVLRYQRSSWLIGLNEQTYQWPSHMPQQIGQ